MRLRLSPALLVAAFLFFMLPSSALAQQAGLKGGVNFATLSDADEEFPNNSQRLGIVAGGWLRRAVTERFSFQIEGLFSEKGISLDVEEQGFTADADIRLRYIELPVLGRADLGVPGSGTRVFVVGGAAPAFKIGARVRASFEGEEETDDISDDIKSFDLGLVGGLGVAFGRAVIEARYTHGLMSIDESDEDSVKNRVFSVTVGVRLR